MNTTVRGRVAALLTTAALLTGGSLTVGSGPASAALSVRFAPSGTPTGFQIEVYRDGDLAGAAEWVQDPVGGSPGDTLYAYDVSADGYGIEAHLSNGRVATTRGHNAPYTDRRSGDLPENQHYTMWVCLVKGSSSTCSAKYGVTSLALTQE
ncbi:hypothetical protein ACFYY8_02410 [Streptosporangium sp. NPDC001559]|uniref:hypothetical protein n=1 Tax=Streptosporangium sp. NPDC001559 TaxID=3366187 RepID=UPI0036EE4A29